MIDSAEKRLPGDGRPLSQHDACHTGWRAQFGNPTGILGAFVGLLMAIKNAPMNKVVSEDVAFAGAESVLEIGAGTGTLLQMLGRRMPGVRLAAIDHSALMARQATRNNSPLVHSGRLKIEVAGVHSLPFPERSFQVVVAVNSFHHWPDAINGLTEVNRVLKTNGRFVLAFRKAVAASHPFAAPGYTDDEKAMVSRQLTEAGFARVESKPIAFGSRTGWIVTASKGPG